MKNVTLGFIPEDYAVYVPELWEGFGPMAVQAVHSSDNILFDHAYARLGNLGYAMALFWKNYLAVAYNHPTIWQMEDKALSLETPQSERIRAIHFLNCPLDEEKDRELSLLMNQVRPVMTAWLGKTGKTIALTAALCRLFTQSISQLDKESPLVNRLLCKVFYTAHLEDLGRQLQAQYGPISSGSNISKEQYLARLEYAKATRGAIKAGIPKRRIQKAFNVSYPWVAKTLTQP